MRCPSCGAEATRVVGTNRVDGLVRRWRVCLACGARWRTWEEWDGRDMWRRDGCDDGAVAPDPDQGRGGV